MPLLPAEPCLYPEDLFSDGSGPRQGDRWWVLHTRPRTEKALARRLFAYKHHFYLPLRQQRWKSNGRSFQSHLPLFSGYVFLRGDEQARLRALETNLVAQVLHVPDSGEL